MCFVCDACFFPPSFFSFSLDNDVLELIQDKLKTTAIIPEQECIQKVQSDVNYII